jgi:hypothetical protein
MLEKLLGSRFFGTTVGHLARRKVILVVFWRGLGLPLMVWYATLTFLECWALIAPALVSHFQQDDHLTFFDVVAYVEIGTYPF